MAFDGICPVVATAEIISKRWALIIVNNLTEGPLGFNELKRCTGDISSKTLSTSLAYLAEEGIVARTVHSNSPIRVEYSLTQKGSDLEYLIEAMRGWGEKWLVHPEKDAACERKKGIKSALHIPEYS